jgi:hypothetical protein
MSAVLYAHPEPFYALRQRMPRRHFPQVDQARTCRRDQLSMQKVRYACEGEQDTVFEWMSESDIPPMG